MSSPFGFASNAILDFQIPTSNYLPDEFENLIPEMTTISIRCLLKPATPKAEVTQGVDENSTTRNGGITISTAQSKYGGSSIYLDGNGDYVTANASTDSINIRTDSYTLELWFMSLANQTQFLCGEEQGNLYLQYFMNNFFFGDGSTNNIAIGSTLQLNTWTHIAISFNGITTRLFKDGIQLHSSTTLLKNYLWTTFCVGARLGGSPTGHSYCYLDSFRITKGVARYTSNFNPETDTYLNV